MDKFFYLWINHNKKVRASQGGVVNFCLSGGTENGKIQKQALRGVPVGDLSGMGYGSRFITSAYFSTDLSIIFWKARSDFAQVEARLPVPLVMMPAMLPAMEP